MRTNNLFRFSFYPYGLLTIALLFGWGCEKRELADLEKISFPATADVFIDDFTPDLAYAAFGGSNVRAFQVDKSITHNNSLQSMRFDVPDANSPTGSYAGGVFLSKTGRNLSGFNALTFYIKASQAATVATLGLGNDLGANKFVVTLSGTKVNTNWTKVIIPIPDGTKLTAERGLFYYATGPENGRGYTFWIDDVRFEKLGTLGTVNNVILNGKDSVISGLEPGDQVSIAGLKCIANLPSGINQSVDISPAYFKFLTSDSSVARVNEVGTVTVIGPGTANITAEVSGKPAANTMRINAVGSVPGPVIKAPTPTRDAANVISLYSNAYPNVTVDTWNTRWQFSTADNTFIKVQGDDVIRYKNLNFVGIEFTSQTINATSMDGFHLDIWTPDNTTAPNNFKVLLVDFGPNNVFGGGDDKSHEVTITAPTLKSNQWVSLDLPLSSFTGLTTRGNLAQLVLSGTVPNLYLDNVYFYKMSTVPSVPAPTPTYSPATVISIFSDAYTNVAGTNLNPSWGQATVVSQIPIAGNNTLVYSGLNYQGLQLGSNQNLNGLNFLHLDYYSINSTSLKVFLISPGPVEKSFTLTVPTTAGWNSVDIPLNNFAPVNLNNVFQLKFEGNGTIYLDNILFRL